MKLIASTVRHTINHGKVTTNPASCDLSVSGMSKWINAADHEWQSRNSLFARSVRHKPPFCPMVHLLCCLQKNKRIFSLRSRLEN